MHCPSPGFATSADKEVNFRLRHPHYAILSNLHHRHSQLDWESTELMIAE